MATLRKGKCYSNLTRPYTRKSKFKKKGFIKAVPQNRVVRYDIGDASKKFQYKLRLMSKEDIQIRHNALESSRLVINRFLNKKLGKEFYLKLHLFPHHILRENKMLTGAHADRLQTGMAHSFGRAVGLAARLKKGRPLFSVNVNKNNIDVARQALKKATPRMPGKFTIEIINN